MDPALRFFFANPSNIVPDRHFDEPWGGRASDGTP